MALSEATKLTIRKLSDLAADLESGRARYCDINDDVELIQVEPKDGYARVEATGKRTLTVTYWVDKQ